MKPFLILQLRPEDAASDDEFRAFLAKGGLGEGDVHRIRLDQQDFPSGLLFEDYSGVIVGGGPGCVSDPVDEKSPVERRIEQAVLGMMPAITARDFPYLGCCYGIGVLAHHLGADVSKKRYAESVGTSTCQMTVAGLGDALLQGLPKRFDAFVGHKEAVQELPSGCEHLLTSDSCAYQMIRHGQNVYATQFHPEADSDGFAVRIDIYRNSGYFAPRDADRLVRMCHAADVHVPELILRNFIEKYRSG
jgi:GMP synthase (glutamine-hydrolysing)